MMMNDEQKKTAPEMAVSETESKENFTATIVAEAEEKSKCDYILPKYWNIDDLKEEAFDFISDIVHNTDDPFDRVDSGTKMIVWFIDYLKHQAEEKGS